MNRLTILLWSLLLCSVYATTKTLASSSSSITSHYQNVKYQESSPSSGILSTVAGYKTLDQGSTADGIPAISKKLGDPEGIAVDNEGNLFIAASGDNKIYKVTASSGIITTVAGTGIASYSGDGGQATAATLFTPSAVALDTTGNIFIADTKNDRIRKVTVSTGVITTVAGNGAYFPTNNVAATSTSLYSPTDVAVDASGNIFIADTDFGLIRKVTASTGIITTIAGTNLEAKGATYGVQSGIPTEQTLRRPSGVALDSAGNVYIAGDVDPCIFKITVSTGNISIVAGTGPLYIGSKGYNGDNMLATKSMLYAPQKVAFDASDNMFIGDRGTSRIRRVSASTGIMTTVAGTGYTDRFNISAIIGDGRSAILQKINSPIGLAVVASGDFYFSSGYHKVVKKVTYTTGTPSSSATAAPAVTPAPSSPIGTMMPSYPMTPRSATTHVAQTLHVTMILLSSLLTLHLC